MAEKLKRSLGLWDSASMVAGIVLGAGIFVVPGLIARELPSAPWIMAAWIAAGLLSFLGALVFAELGAMIPETGGHYVFLREAFGDLPAFLCGWTFFVVIQPSVTAYLAANFAQYLGYFVSIPPLAAGLGLIVALGAVNYFGIRWGARVQNVFTAAKLLGVAILIGSAWFVPATPAPPAASVTAPAFGVAMIACLMAFEGWSYLSFIAGEVRDPQRNLVRAVAIGLGVCGAIYLLANAAYLRVLTIEELTASPRPGALAAERTLGSFGGTLVSLVILVAIVGSANGQLLAPARVYFAQARDGLFFRRFAEVHPRHGSPYWALLGVSVWSAMFLLTNAWQTLLNYAIFSNWLIVTGVIASLIALRRRQPDRPRPFRMWGYPATAYLFLALAIAFCANTLIERSRDSAVALVLILAGVPVFYGTLKRWTRS